MKPLRLVKRAALVQVLAVSVLLLGGMASTDLAPRTLAGIVKLHFQQWDADASGTLTPEEIDRLTVDPAWKGDDAAAIATLKLAFRAKNSPLESLSLADVDPAALRAAPQDPDDAAPSAHDGKRPVTLEGSFQRASRAIRRSKRTLFLDPTPDLDRLHQGRIGDCFFVSMVGAMVERDPESVKKMIVVPTQPDGDFKIDFAGGRSVTVPPLTDAEFALASTTGDEGAWLPILEKGFGMLRMSSRPEDKRMLSSTDAIARGGSMGTSIAVLTGHRADSVRLSHIKTPKSSDDQAAFVDSVRKRITEALAAKRLVGAGTDKEPGVPGISPNHAYAILAYDAANDKVHMWNPHGNTFRPKGEPGKAAGYPTRAGKFDVPLGEFVTTFQRLFIETDRPADAGRPHGGPSHRPAPAPRRERTNTPAR